MNNYARLVVPTVVFSSLLWGCQESTKVGKLGASCSKTDDCSSGSVCSDGRCSPVSCLAGTDCGSGAVATMSITNVTGDMSTGRVGSGLVISGEGFSADTTATLVSAALNKTWSLVIGTANASTITAGLPAELNTLVTSTTVPLGLTLTLNSASAGSATRDVSLLRGADGAAGLAGPTGAPGINGTNGSPGPTGPPGASSPMADGQSNLRVGNVGTNSGQYGTFVGARVGTTSTVSGWSNTAVGSDAMKAIADGASNDAFGVAAQESLTSGCLNTAFGNGANGAITTEWGNVAIGTNALHIAQGGYNVALGLNAGSNLSSGSNNVYIANSGVSSESNTVRIGLGTHTATYIAGINGQTSSGGTAVYIDNTGKLGTTTSSARYKDDVEDIGHDSEILMKLRPVKFKYKKELDEKQIPQYGLIAEQVAEISPDLVAFFEDGTPNTVRYHLVNAMLLNEVQQDRRLIDDQQRALEEQRTHMRAQAQLIQAQAAELHAQSERLQAIERRLSAAK